MLYYICFLNSDQQRNETKPIKINSSPNTNSQERIVPPKASLSSFEDVIVDNTDEDTHSSSTKKENKTKSKLSNSSFSRHDKNSNYTPQQHNFDEQMLLDSMIDETVEDEKANHQTNHRRSNHSNSNDVFLLLNAKENLTVIKKS